MTSTTLRRLRTAALGSTAVLLVLFVRDMYLVTQWPHDQLASATLGDYRIYVDATHRWLATGQWYQARQLAPYAIQSGDVLYPPVILWLLVPFALLPSSVAPFLWVTIPVALVVMVVWHHQPAWWSWPLLAFCLWWWRTPSQIIHGNPMIWIAAAVALGTVHRWPAALAVVKVSVLPFALVGIRHRSWWATLGLVGLLSLPVWQATLDYPGVLANIRDPTISYSFPEYPTLAIPVIAWLASRRRADSDPSRVPRGLATWPEASTGAM